MPGARAALLVVNAQYDDDGLRQLKAPGADAAALAEVLSDRSVGSFDVRILQDGTTQAVRVAIEEFFADRAPDDLLLLHIDESQLTSPVLRERAPGSGEEFPHVYGPINLDAIVKVEPITSRTPPRARTEAGTVPG